MHFLCNYFRMLSCKYIRNHRSLRKNHCYHHLVHLLVHMM